MKDERNGRRRKWATGFLAPESYSKFKNHLVSVDFYSFNRMMEAKLQEIQKGVGIQKYKVMIVVYSFLSKKDKEKEKKENKGLITEKK